MNLISRAGAPKKMKRDQDVTDSACSQRKEKSQVQYAVYIIQDTQQTVHIIQDTQYTVYNILHDAESTIIVMMGGF